MRSTRNNAIDNDLPGSSGSNLCYVLRISLRRRVPTMTAAAYEQPSGLVQAFMAIPTIIICDGSQRLRRIAPIDNRRAQYHPLQESIAQRQCRRLPFTA
jgi:hypothetical protein